MKLLGQFFDPFQPLSPLLPAQSEQQQQQQQQRRQEALGPLLATTSPRGSDDAKRGADEDGAVVGARDAMEEDHNDDALFVHGPRTSVAGHDAASAAAMDRVLVPDCNSAMVVAAYDRLVVVCDGTALLTFDRMGNRIGEPMTFLHGTVTDVQYHHALDLLCVVFRTTDEKSQLCFYKNWTSPETCFQGELEHGSIKCIATCPLLPNIAISYSKEITVYQLIVDEAERAIRPKFLAVVSTQSNIGRLALCSNHLAYANPSFIDVISLDLEDKSTRAQQEQQQQQPNKMMAKKCEVGQHGEEQEHRYSQADDREGTGDATDNDDTNGSNAYDEGVDDSDDDDDNNGNSYSLMAGKEQNASNAVGESGELLVGIDTSAQVQVMVDEHLLPWKESLSQFLNFPGLAEPVASTTASTPKKSGRLHPAKSAQPSTPLAAPTASSSQEQRRQNEKTNPRSLTMIAPSSTSDAHPVRVLDVFVATTLDFVCHDVTLHLRIAVENIDTLSLEPSFSIPPEDFPALPQATCERAPSSTRPLLLSSASQFASWFDHVRCLYTDSSDAKLYSLREQASSLLAVFGFPGSSGVETSLHNSSKLFFTTSTGGDMHTLGAFSLQLLNEEQGLDIPSHSGTSVSHSILWLCNHPLNDTIIRATTSNMVFGAVQSNFSTSAASQKSSANASTITPSPQYPASFRVSLRQPTSAAAMYEALKRCGATTPRNHPNIWHTIHQGSLVLRAELADVLLHKATASLGGDENTADGYLIMLTTKLSECALLLADILLEEDDVDWERVCNFALMSGSAITDVLARIASKAPGSSTCTSNTATPAPVSAYTKRDGGSMGRGRAAKSPTQSESSVVSSTTATAAPHAGDGRPAEPASFPIDGAFQALHIATFILKALASQELSRVCNGSDGDIGGVYTVLQDCLLAAGPAELCELAPLVLKSRTVCDHLSQHKGLVVHVQLSSESLSTDTLPCANRGVLLLLNQILQYQHLTRTPTRSELVTYWDQFLLDGHFVDQVVLAPLMEFPSLLLWASRDESLCTTPLFHVLLEYPSLFVRVFHLYRHRRRQRQYQQPSQHLGSSLSYTTIFALIDSECSDENVRTCVKAKLCLSTLRDPVGGSYSRARPLSRLPRDQKNAVVVETVRIYVQAVAAKRPVQGLTELGFSTEHRHPWLDDLPPYATAYLPGVGGSAATLALLRHLQAFCCVYTDPSNVDDILSIVEADPNFPGYHSLKFLCEAHLGISDPLIMQVLDCNPCVLSKYIASSHHAGDASVWKRALASIARHLQGEHGTDDLAAQHESYSPAQPLTDEDILLRHSDYLSAYRACLREASSTLGADALLDILPDTLRADFSLPFLLHATQRDHAGEIVSVLVDSFGGLRN